MKAASRAASWLGPWAWIYITDPKANPHALLTLRCPRSQVQSQSGSTHPKLAHLLPDLLPHEKKHLTLLQTPFGPAPPWSHYVAVYDYTEHLLTSTTCILFHCCSIFLHLFCQPLPSPVSQFCSIYDILSSFSQKAIPQHKPDPKMHPTLMTFARSSHPYVHWCAQWSLNLGN